MVLIDNKSTFRQIIVWRPPGDNALPEPGNDDVVDYIRQQGPLLLTWININPCMDN